MDAVPHGPLSLIAEYIKDDLYLLPLFHTSINLKEIVEEIQTRKQPYKRRLFYNLMIQNLNKISIDGIKFYLAQGGKLSSSFVNKIYEKGDREIIDWIIDQGNKPNHMNLGYAAKGGHLEVVKFLCGVEWSSKTRSVVKRGQASLEF
jgi:hypothetical protein